MSNLLLSRVGGLPVFMGKPLEIIQYIANTPNTSVANLPLHHYRILRVTDTGIVGASFKLDHFHKKDYRRELRNSDKVELFRIANNSSYRGKLCRIAEISRNGPRAKVLIIDQTLGSAVKTNNGPPVRLCDLYSVGFHYIYRNKYSIIHPSVDELVAGLSEYGKTGAVPEYIDSNYVPHGTEDLNLNYYDTDLKDRPI